MTLRTMAAQAVLKRPAYRFSNLTIKFFASGIVAKYKKVKVSINIMGTHWHAGVYMFTVVIGIRIK